MGVLRNLTWLGFLAASVAAQPADDLASARRLFEAGQRGEAKIVLDRICAAPEAPAEAFALRGLALLDPPFTDLAEAEKSLRVALSRDGGNVHGLFGAGVLHIRRKEHVKARPFLVGAVRKAPGYTEAWYHLGLVHYETGELEGAFAAFRKATTKPEAVEYLALILSRRQRYPEAADLLQRALDKLGPNWADRPRVMYQKAAYLRLAADLDEVRPLVEGALAAGYRRTEVLNEMGRVHYDAGELDAAEKVYREASEAPSIHGGAAPMARARSWFQLGVIAYNRRDWEAALNALQKAIELDRYHENAWYKLGRTLKKVDRDSEAKLAFANHEEVRRLVRGMRSAEQSLDNTPDDHKTRMTLVRILEALERWDDALHHLRVIEARAPGHPGVNRMTVQIAEKAGMTELATRYRVRAAEEGK